MNGLVRPREAEMTGGIEAGQWERIEFEPRSVRIPVAVG
jgi:hypothetical protein